MPISIPFSTRELEDRFSAARAVQEGQVLLPLALFNSARLQDLRMKLKGDFVDEADILLTIESGGLARGFSNLFPLKDGIWIAVTSCVFCFPETDLFRWSLFTSRVFVRSPEKHLDFYRRAF